MADKPEIPAGYDILLVHYRRLSNSRTAGFSSANPIAIGEILSYNDRVTRLDPEFFIDIVQMIDSLVLGDKDGPVVLVDKDEPTRKPV